MTTREAARALARGKGSEREYRERQRQRIKAYWDSARSKGHRQAMKDRPIRKRALVKASVNKPQ